MKKVRKILVVDARSSLLQLIERLQQDHWEVERLSSARCGPDVTQQKELHRDSIALALSGSDEGLAIAHAINCRLGLSQTEQIDALYDKVAQHAFIKQHAPSLALPGARYFEHEAALKEYLITTGQATFIRPNISSINGSAILYEGNYQAIQPEIEHLFSYARQVITHPFLDGTSYFLNGIVVEGTFHMTDGWQCFNVFGNHRYILTSVISTDVNEPLIQAAYPSLQALCALFNLRFTPIHFELLFTSKGHKVIKMVPRLTTEPLPTLSRLAGIQNHSDTLLDMLTEYSWSAIPQRSRLQQSVADYSFFVKAPGIFQDTRCLEPFMALPSYHQLYDLPAVGTLLPKTVCGATYGATLLFRHADKNQVLRDINYCQQMNIGTVLNSSQ